MMRRIFTIAVTTVVAVLLAMTTFAGAAQAATSPWANNSAAKFEWRTNNTPKAIKGVKYYGMHGESTSATSVKALKNTGAQAICYFSAGTWEDFRNDASTFPWSSVGNDADNTGGERYLDIRNIKGLTPVMSKRMDECKRKGFTAVVPGKVDTYTKKTGFPLTSSHQLAYNKALSKLAKSKGLKVGLHNDTAQTAALVGSFDFAVNEGCVAAKKCGVYAPFKKANKLVLNIEYKATSTRCAVAKTNGVASILKRTNLDAYRVAC